MVDAAREVVFTLKAVADASTAAEFRNIAQQVRSAQKDIDAARKSSSDVHGRFLDEEAKRAQQLNKQTVADEQRAQAERSQAIRQGMLGRLADEEKAAKERVKQEETSQKAIAISQKQAAHEAATAQKEREAAESRAGKAREAATIASERAKTAAVIAEIKAREAAAKQQAATQSDLPSVIAAEKAKTAAVAAEEKAKTAARQAEEAKTIASLRQQQVTASEAERAKLESVIQAEKQKTLAREQEGAQAVALQKEQEAATIASEKVKAAAAIQAEKQKQDAAKQTQQVELQAERASEKYNQSLVQLAASRHGILLGAMHVGRGLALLMSSSEKEARKLMEALMKIQGAYDVLRGSIHIIEGLNRAWTLYAEAQLKGAAAATLSTTAHEASARAASQAAVAHAEDATAAEADAIANQHLAVTAGESAVAQGAGGAAKIGGLGGFAGRAMTLGARGLAAVGGGSVGMGAAVIGLPLLAGAAAYSAATAGPNADAAAAQKRTEEMEAGIERQREAEEAGRRQQDQIEHIERQRREGQAKLREGAFERGMTREEKMREMTAPSIEKMMSGWSASREEGGRRDPGAIPSEPAVPAPQAAAKVPVGLPVQPPAPGLPAKVPSEPAVPAPQAAAKISTYDDVEKAIAIDKAAGESIVAKYQAEADKAAKDVAAKQETQTKAEEDAKPFRQQAAVNRGHATGIEQKLSDDTAQQTTGWLYGTNWLKGVARFGTRNTEAGKAEAQQREKLKESLPITQHLAEGSNKQAGEMAEKAKARQQDTIDAKQAELKANEKVGEEQEKQAKRNIENAEKYISKLKEMHEAHLKNAEAIEKAGRALVTQMALEKPHARHKLERAIEHAKSGKATMKEYALLAREASPEKAEEFEKKGLATLTPEQRARFEGTAEFLGKGKSAVNRQKAMAADEEKKIKQQEDYVAGAKQSALKAADTMTNKLASILKELFGSQEQRFTEALERIRSDIHNAAHANKTLAE